MKRVLRWIVLAGVVAIAVHWLKARIVPSPQLPPTPPPSFPPAAPPPPPPPPAAEATPEAESAADDLTTIKGIGPVYAARLGELGIRTFSDLAAADPSELTNRLEGVATDVEDWVEQARGLAG